MFLLGKLTKFWHGGEISPNANLSKQYNEHLREVLLAGTTLNKTLHSSSYPPAKVWNEIKSLCLYHWSYQFFEIGNAVNLC